MVREFSLKEIKSATNGFHESRLIGCGRFGKVYKGVMASCSTVVAIKQLNKNSSQGRKEFFSEVEALSKVSHAHIVPLVGYNSSSRERCLVYEFMTKGSLSNYLFRECATCPLSWQQRLDICIGVARGLAYLHGEMDTHRIVIHRDVKPSNILLDENFVPKISDFGISKFIPSDDTHVSTVAMGTVGYLDPEYFRTQCVSTKIDVYAFGVVMLEVLSGRRVTDLQLEAEERNLTSWALGCIKKGEHDFIVDPNIREQISLDCLEFFAQVATQCISIKPEKRPTMAKVVFKLELALIYQFQGTTSLGSSVDLWRLKSKENDKDSESESSSDAHTKIFSVSKNMAPQPQVETHFWVNETQPVTYCFDEAVQVGVGGPSKLYRFCIDHPVAAHKETRTYGKKTSGAGISEQRTTLQLKDQKDCEKERQGELSDGQTKNKSQPIKRMMEPITTILPIFRSTKKEKNILLDEIVVAKGESMIAYDENSNEKSADHELSIQGEGLPAATIPQEQKRGASTSTSSFCMCLEPEGSGITNSGIKELKTMDGAITPSDSSSDEVRLEFEALNGVREDIRHKLQRIMKLRPETFVHICKLSPRFVKSIMEFFGGFIELLERTVLKEASQKTFDEMLWMLEDLKRNMLQVDWLEERVRAMSTRVKLDMVNSELRMTTQKASEYVVLLAELEDKTKKLEVEARHLEKQHYVNLDMDGNAAQVLF